MQVEEKKWIDPFHFKSFTIEQDGAPMKVGTDGVLLGAWACQGNAKSVLDIGAGTGVIGLIAAQRMKKAQVTSVEINEWAFANCRHNFQSSPWAARLHPVNSRIQDFASKTSKQFDCIICNPPFFTGGTLSKSADRNIFRHTTRLPNGELLQSVRKLLSAKGHFYVILPTIEGYQFEDMAQRYGIYCNKLVEVCSKKGKKIERLLMQFSKVKSISKVSQLVIQHERRNDYTAAYRDLTSDLYTIFE